MDTLIERELQSMLRGEIAAAETYKQVLASADGSEATALREVQNDHGDAIKFLYDELSARGVEPPTSSGTWGVVARAVQGTAKLIGDKAALATLREGEKQGLKDYENALAEGHLPGAAGAHVERRLIPAQQRHIAVLDRLIEQAG